MRTGRLANQDEQDRQAEQVEQVGQLLDTPDLAGALESDRFKQFLDHLPVAIAVSELKPRERIVYCNLEFERLSERGSDEIVGRLWNVLPGWKEQEGGSVSLGDAIAMGGEFLGSFTIDHDDGDDDDGDVDDGGNEGAAARVVDAWSTIIEDEAGEPVYRLVALVASPAPDEGDRETLERRIRDKDVLLRELQHRVKNNLQMVTALIRLEARNVADREEGDRLDRLAGRVGALALLYRALSDEGKGDEIDLGIYLSQIASAVMQAHATEGIRLDLKVDAWPVSINIAMPTGLVVNELLTNALKYAFAGRDGGTITLHSLVDDEGCRVIVADDGVGLPEGVQWPRPGKLGALIVRSLRENACATIDVRSAPAEGTRAEIRFTRAAAAAAAA